MTLKTKILVVVLCFAACAAGAFVAPSVRDQSQPVQKANAIPIKNHEVARHVWIVATRL
jgi:hypothetical protein